MADNVYDIGIGTGVDVDGLKKELSETEKEVIKSASKILETIEKNAQEQTAVIKKEQDRQIDDLKRHTKEQIALEKTKGGPDLQARIQAIKNAADIELKTIKNNAKLQEAAVKQMAQAQTKVIQDQAKKQLKAVQDNYKKQSEAIKGFVKGALQELAGIDQLLSIAQGGGPVALGKAFTDMSKKAIAALNEMAEAWRQQEQAEIALQNAAKNNPYLNERSVRQLTQFANEMQRMTGIDNVQILQTETRLASLGRNQQQMQKIIKTAADLAASGVMTFDEAINELNNSYNGLIRASGRLYPELKNLSQEAFASGEAVDIIAGKVAGSAAKAMETGAGSVKAYENALSSLKKYIGEGWEQATAPARNWITGLLNKINETLAKKKMLQDAEEAIRRPSEENLARLEQERKLLDQITSEYKRVYAESERAARGRRADAGELGIQAADLYNQMQEIENRIKAINEETKLQNKYTEDNLYIEINALQKLSEAYEERKNNAIAYRSYTKQTLEAIEEQYKKPTAEIVAQQEKVLNIQKNILQKIYDEQVGYTDKIAELREASNKKLNEEIELIEKRAGTEKDSAEVQIEILNARIAAENALLDAVRQKTKVDEESDENRRTAAEKLIEENEAARKDAIKQIELQAKLEEKSLESIEVQKQILDANTQAYKNLLVSAKDYLDLIDDDTLLKNLKQEWEQYQALELSEKDRAKRLAELAKEQEQLASRLQKIYEDTQGEAKKQADLARERDLQNQLETIRKLGIDKAIEYEASVSADRATQAANEKKKELDQNKEQQLQALTDLQTAELEKHKGNAKERERIEQEFQNKREELILDHARAVSQIDQNLASERERINAEMLARMEQAEQDALQKRLAMVQEYLNFSQQIAGGISSLWTGIVDQQTEKKLRDNDEMIQSDEDRAKKEKEIMIEAARDRYKAELFAWHSNVTAATASAAMSVLEAFRKGTEAGGVPLGLAYKIMAIAAATGQIAQVASAMPKPPRFHTGGPVPGSGEVPAVLMGGEVVSTQRQFNNTMQAIANLAEMKGGGATMVQPQVQINNTVSDQASVSTRVDPEGLIIDIVKKGFGNGSFDTALATQTQNQRGLEVSN